jgi:hypothetical protein
VYVNDTGSGANSSSFRYNSSFGIYAQACSYVDVRGNTTQYVQISNNAFGMYGWGRSVIYGLYCIASNNTNYGFAVHGMSQGYVYNSQASQNTDGIFCFYNSSFYSQNITSPGGVNTNYGINCYYGATVQRVSSQPTGGIAGTVSGLGGAIW